MNTKVNKFLFFEDARRFVRSLNLKTRIDYLRHIGFSECAEILPRAPDYYYDNWTDWYDFLGKSRDRRTYCVNDNYFKEWSYNMAYIFGFWFADGYITKGSVFSIKQHIKDKYLLKEILEEMESNYPLREDIKNNCCYFEINSKTIYNDVIALGGKERKSLSGKFPNIPKKYLPDFVRGYFDGDGSISAGRKSKKTGRFFGYRANIYSGNEEFLLDLRKILEENIKDINVGFYINKIRGGETSIYGRILKNDAVVYSLMFSPNNLRKLRDFMYFTPSPLKLIRKYEKFVDAGEYRISSRDINYMKFENAKKLLKEKNFRSVHDYNRWIKSDKCNVTLPVNPNVVYKEWISWPDFLGHYRLSYNELSEMVVKNNIQSRREYGEWIKKERNGTWGRYPANPYVVYKEWSGWDKFFNKV